MDKPTIHNFAISTPNTQQLDKQRAVAAEAQTFVNTLIENCPAGPELDMALVSLRSCTLWANQGITTATGAARKAGG